MEKRIKELFESFPILNFKEQANRINNGVHSARSSEQRSFAKGEKGEDISKAFHKYRMKSFDKTSNFSKDEMKLLEDFKIPMHQYQSI